MYLFSSYPLVLTCPGFSWEGANFPLSSYCVLDLVWEECW